MTISYIFQRNINQSDIDHDGVGDAKCENCPSQRNPRQENADDDETGDVCDHDDDNDGIGEYNYMCLTLVRLVRHQTLLEQI